MTIGRPGTEEAAKVQYMLVHVVDDELAAAKPWQPPGLTAGSPSWC
jgi:hypothetical protein